MEQNLNLQMVSLACSAPLDFYAAITLWTVSPGKGPELCLTPPLPGDAVERHCHAQRSSGSGTERFHSRQKTCPSCSVPLLKLHLVIFSLMAVNVFSLDLGRLPSGSRDICEQMLSRSTILGDALGYFTTTHCLVSGLSQSLKLYCKWGEKIMHKYWLFHKTCTDKTLNFQTAKSD